MIEKFKYILIYSTLTFFSSNQASDRIEQLEEQVKELRKQEQALQPSEIAGHHIKCPASCPECSQRTNIVIQIGKLLQTIDALKK